MDEYCRERVWKPYRAVNMDAPLRSNGKRIVAQVVDLTESASKSTSIGKNFNLGTNSSSNANESPATTPRRVKPKLRLINGKRSNADLSRNPSLDKFSQRVVVTALTELKTSRTWDWAFTSSTVINSWHVPIFGACSPVHAWRRGGWAVWWRCSSKNKGHLCGWRH